MLDAACSLQRSQSRAKLPHFALRRARNLDDLCQLPRLLLHFGPCFLRLSLKARVVELEAEQARLQILPLVLTELALVLEQHHVF